MTPARIGLIGLTAAFCLSGCLNEPHFSPGEGVSQELARERKNQISALHYDLSFTLPEKSDEKIRGTAVLDFKLAENRSPLVLDFQASSEQIHTLRRGEEELEYRLADGHLILEAGRLPAGPNRLEIEFTAGEAPLNRRPGYVYTLFVPDRASQLFPCFDQPDLKARFRLNLDTPASWSAISNGPLLKEESHGKRKLFHFDQTRPISTYLLAFAAGEFQVEAAERSGRRLQLYHRETDAEKVERNREAVFDLHEAALRWLGEYTGRDYPFEKLDFVLIPGFQFGGMEHPGAIFYRDTHLWLDKSATQAQELRRAQLIAHETAHMWFGNLVTMEWFNDVWTKEVFANFMASKIVNPSFPHISHDLQFLLNHFPPAYRVDRSQGTHPIRQPLQNLDEAASLYGPIIYQKAPIVMRQLESLIGETAFQKGIRAYLDKFEYSNASWPDLIDLLDQESEQDLRSWSRRWIEESGRPTVRANWSANRGRLEYLQLLQTDPAGDGRVWSQQMEVLISFPGGRSSSPVVLSQASQTVSGVEGLPAPQFVLPDRSGRAYGLIRLDPLSREFLMRHLPNLSGEMERAEVWLSLWDEMLEGAVSPSQLLDLALTLLRRERVELLIQHLLADVSALYWRFLSPQERQERSRELEEVLWSELEEAREASLKSAWFKTYRATALSAEGVARLEAIWRREQAVPDLELSESDEIDLALELALRVVPGWNAILKEQLERIENPERKARFQFVMASASSYTSVRRHFFQALQSPAQRRQETWVLAALGYLHHPLRAEQSEGFIQPSLEMLEEIERTGDIFFPTGWLEGTLSGHRTAQAAAVVQDFLESRPEYPPRLRLKILQAADELFRISSR